jgi:uncharacterized protein (DUF1330 family)
MARPIEELDKMMVTGIVILTLCLAAWLYALGGREPASRMENGPVAWFIATRGDFDLALEDQISMQWQSEADFAFIGDDDAYWSRFAILTGERSALGNIETELLPASDALIAEIELIKPPRIFLGLLRALHLTGLRGAPKGNVDVEQLLSHGEGGVLPTRKSIETLRSRALDYAPAMVNFLSFKERATYPDGDRGRSGAAAYQVYGLQAIRAVYRTGGSLVFFARRVKMVRVPTNWHDDARWHTFAVMQYRSRDAILTMETIPAYRAALGDRDAGLASTIVIASSPREQDL